MPNTPNYNFAVYPASDITTKVITYRTATSGTQADSNFMVLDSALKDIQDQVTALKDTPGLTQIIASGENAYVATSAGFTYMAGQSIILSVNTTNTNSSTLNINSLGVRPLMKYKSDGTLAQLSVNDLRANNLYLFTNKGTSWAMVGYANAEQINVNGTVGNMVGISSNNTLIDSGLAQSAIEVKVNIDYTAYEAIAAKEIVGLGTDNKWHKVKTGNSFPVGTIYGVAENAVAANATVRVIMTGTTNPLWTSYTTTTLDTNTKIFIKGEITDGQFLPTDIATTVMEPDASYLSIGYYASTSATKLDATHMIYTLNTDGNVNAIDGVSLGGASGGSGSTRVWSIGNGTQKEFPLNHGANTTFVQLLVRTTATPQTYLVPDWQIIDNNNVNLIFDVAPTTNQYQAILFVFNPSTKITKYEEVLPSNGTTTTFYIKHDLGVNYPSVKLIQLTNEALVFPSIQYVDNTGAPSQTTLKLGFYSAPSANSLKVLVESDVVQTEGASMFGGQLPQYYQSKMVILGLTANVSVPLPNDGKVVWNKVVYSDFTESLVNNGTISMPSGYKFVEVLYQGGLASPPADGGRVLLNIVKSNDHSSTIGVVTNAVYGNAHTAQVSSLYPISNIPSGIDCLFVPSIPQGNSIGANSTFVTLRFFN